VIRIDDINDTEYDEIVSTGVVALAVDRVNNLVYYTDGSQLSRCDYDGLNKKTYTDYFNNIRGMAVDDQGMVYIVSSPEGDAIEKYDPSAEGAYVDSRYSGLSWPWDVVVKPPHLYVTNTDNYEILQLDMNDLSKDPIVKYGKQDDSEPPDQGEFYGPRRFVGILNKKLTVTDEDGFWNQDRLVSFDDTLDGSGWETYGTYGTGTDGPGHFSFFNLYGY